LNEDFEETTKEQIFAIRKMNCFFPTFSTAFATDKEMSMVYAEYTEVWTEGEAYFVVIQLMKWYRPKT
jgi:hypothetical protein